MALDHQQLELLSRWLPGAVIEHDYSWGLVGTTVLQVGGVDGTRYIVKAGDAHDHHIERELAAHRQWLAVWMSTGQAPRLVHGDDAAKLIVTEFLPGQLVEGTDSEWQLDTYRQAGELLARFHDQYAVLDDGEYESHQKAKTLSWLKRPHRIDEAATAVLTAEVESWPTPHSLVVPTHGDWQPRNWLVHESCVSVIDFGRAELRPRHTDFGRLAVQQFRTMPALESAFLDGYDGDPRRTDAWRRLQVHDAITTAAWSHHVGDESYERQGLRMIADVLSAL
ncbi:aminoglycoside phosphotransferase family protein [Kribbella sp. NPDC005582]|uniref:aminoglycoside phosphotransferase family protein n=1 Tax=Kribbella sp. NPDC005582 TaxID=3156893 RepID=UPI0033BDC3DD